MSRIESPALREIESKNATCRRTASTEAFVSRIIAFQVYAVARKGGNPHLISDTAESRAKMSLEISRCASYATEL